MFIELLISLFTIYALIILLGATDTNTNNADYLIVLGTSLINNKISPCLKARCDCAYKYLKNNPNTMAVLSGGLTSNNTVCEAAAMYDYLIALGLDENRIILEDKSINTIENIKFSLNKIDCNCKIVIMSNNYHLFRAKMIASLFGVKAKAIGIKTEFVELLKHLFIEEVFIIKNYLRIKKDEAI